MGGFQNVRLAKFQRSRIAPVDKLEDLDDVQSVTANFEMAEELMALTLA